MSKRALWGRRGLRKLLLVGLCLTGLTGYVAPSAQAERPLITKEGVKTEKVPGGLEGACGVAVISGTIYVSDYYHHGIDLFSSGSGEYLSRIAGDPVDGPCQLATSAGGALYANDWHEGVSRMLPSALSFDTKNSTGVAVDQATGNVYVNDRTYVAVYEPSGAAVLDEGAPLRIGLGTLGDAYGLAVAGGKVYVPDAADDTVKVYEPAIDPTTPAAVIDGTATPQGRFVSLVDAAVAVDPANGHLVVLDNLQPGFEFPQAAIEEFDSAGNFLGQVAQKVIDGEPGGLAFDAGALYVTSGNSEQAAVFKFGAYTGVVPLAAQSSLLPAAESLTPDAGSSGPAAAGTEGATQALRLSSASAAKDGTATITAVLPAAGTLAAAGRGLTPLRRQVGAGRRVLRLHLAAAGRRALARAKLGELKVRVRVTFTPDAGAALSARKTVIFKTYKGETR
jgi:DNA-binding beta-propeller fold protein YncE